MYQSDLSASEKRILLVDDDEDLSEALEITLGYSGFQITVAHTYADAMDRLQSEHYDMYILDTLLSDGSGLELCKHVREIDQNTPILFFSVLVRESDKKQGLAAGAKA